MKRITYILIIIQLCYFTDVFPQITTHGELKTNKLNNLRKSDEIPVISMPSFNVDQMLVEDKLNEGQINQPLRFAKVFEVDIDIKKEGLEENTGDGLLWRLKIKSSGAYSLNFIFKEYELPEGARLFIYNTNETQVVGALTQLENHKDVTLLYSAR